jgi:hypothetical protein
LLRCACGLLRHACDDGFSDHDPHAPKGGDAKVCNDAQSHFEHVKYLFFCRLPSALFFSCLSQAPRGWEFVPRNDRKRALRHTQPFGPNQQLPQALTHR